MLSKHQLGQWEVWQVQHGITGSSYPYFTQGLFSKMQYLSCHSLQVCGVITTLYVDLPALEF
jgi:hypothetical protein